MTKVKQKKTVVDDALINSNRLYIFSYLCSLIKLYCTINPYFLNKFICYIFLVKKVNKLSKKTKLFSILYEDN